jgi:glycosyltransferase involved in cell wall biosynthesis
MDIAVLCSDREGLSNAILEAMAAGLPVVATNVGGNGELVDGTSGILVPRGDTGKLAGALGALIVDDERRQQLGARARARVAGQFSWESAMAQLTTWYDQLLAAHGSALPGCRQWPNGRPPGSEGEATEI